MLKKLIGGMWSYTPKSIRICVIRATQQKFTVSVAAIITNDSGKVLVLDHVLRPVSSWGLPGGFIDPDEQPEAAIRREILEETNLELDDLSLFRIRTIGRHVEILFVAKGIGNATVKSHEINALGWFNCDELPETMSRAQRQLIEEVLRDR